MSNEDYKKGYRDGYRDGRNDRPNVDPWIEPWPSPAPKKYETAKCPVCGINYNEMNLYCCMNNNCPNKVRYTW